VIDLSSPQPRSVRYLRPALLLLLGAILAQGCTSAVKTTRSTGIENPAVDRNRVRVDQVVNWLDRTSIAARALSAEGSMTVANQETSQNAHFTLSSKRLDAESSLHNSNRADSLSIIITGPFGISVARFLASPSEYFFYNSLNGDSFHGATDAHSLEALTQMKGVSLSLLNDALYGLAPGAENINPQDSIILLSIGDDDHILLIQHKRDSLTEAIYLHGSIPDGAEPIPVAGLTVDEFQRWKGMVGAEELKKTPALMTIHYRDLAVHDGVVLPKTIEARTGNNQLSIEYSTVRANHDDLVVKIKIPKS
jgi:Domain of unknown function (DUF4292)